MSAILSAASGQYFTSGFLWNPDNGSITLAMWVKAASWNTSGTTTMRTLAQQEDSSGTGRTWLAVRTGATTSNQNAYSFLGNLDNVGATELNGSLSTWMLLGVSLASGSGSVNCNVWLNGASDGVVSGNPNACFGVMRFGAHKAPSSTLDYWDGRFGPIGVYSGELTSTHWGDLWNGGAGQAMTNVNSGSLMHYWPMLSNADPVFIDSGSHSLTAVNSPTFDNTDHPFGAVAPAAKLPVFMNHFRQAGMLS